MTLLTETLPPADQPYPVPENWVWVKLKVLLQKIEKIDPSKAKIGKFTYLDISSIDNSSYQITDPKIYLDSEAPSRAQQIIQTDDILFSTVRPYLKNIAMVDAIYNKQIASTGFCVMRSTHTIESKLLFYFVISNEFINRLNEFQRGSSYPAVKTSTVLDQPIPIPPLPEQRRIAAKLDALLGKLREARALLDEARESFALRRAAILHQAFSGMLTAQWRAEHPDITARSGGWFDEDIKETPYQIPETWKWISLGSVCRLKHGFAFKKDDYCEKGIPIIRISDIHDGRVSFKYAQNVPETLYDERFQVKKGDILIALSGATTGKNGVFYDDVFVMQNQRVGNLKISRPDILIEGYRNFFIQHSQTQILQLAYGGAQPNINADLIEGLPLPLPPFEEQREIVRQLDSLLGHEAAAAALLDMDDELDLLEQSILSRAFRGELGTNDPAEPPAI